MTRIAFVSTRCILDRRSGAAIEMKGVLEQLAARGFDCHSITMTRFDGAEPFPMERLVGAEHAAERNRYHFLQADHRRVRHRLYYTGSTRLADLTRTEAEQFARGAARLLGSIRPDLVLTTGTDPLSVTLHRLARSAGAVVVFYLANAGFTRFDSLQSIDEFWCPTRTLADDYRRRLGIEPRVVRNLFTDRQFVERPDRVVERARVRGHVTMVNPSPEKGATLFFRLARLAGRERPDIRFLAVEARTSRSVWCGIGIDPAEQGRIRWVRNRADMRPVLRRTALLLYPSYCFEAAGRVPVEAQLTGIPVLAMDRGGIAEQLNGGGHLFPPPPACLDDYLHMPSRADVRPWLDRIAALLDNPQAYARAAAEARTAAAPFHPDVRLPELEAEVEATLADHRQTSPTENHAKPPSRQGDGQT